MHTLVVGSRSVHMILPRTVHPAVVPLEIIRNIGMPDRRTRSVRQQILLRHIGNVFGLVILREQMIKRLVLARTNLGGDGLPPLVRVRKFRVNVEDYASKGKEAVLYDLADLKFGDTRLVHAAIK
jgi:hypothetical protein